MSLQGTIVNMAQDFVGSNNINLLMPNGQFGTRLQGGKDSASERYIYTKLNPLTRKVFRKEDDMVLRYLDDDGLSVEPIYYVPIIPMVLVNGALGIGTGFATTIPCFDPKQLVQIIKKKIRDDNLKMNYVEEYMNPYYRGFKGTITKIDNYKYITTGCTHIKDKTTLVITELPVGLWNESYLSFLEKCIDTKKFELKDYKDLSTDKDVHIELYFTNKVNLQQSWTMDKMIQNMKCTTSLSTSNMYLFNKDEILTKYDSVNDIINEFVTTRMDYYIKRKDAQIKHMESLLQLYSNKYTFVMELLNDTIDLRKNKSSDIEALLVSKQYDKIENSYHYLIKMPMDNVNEENVQKLKNEYDHTRASLDILKATTPVSIYYNELCELEKSI